jgi:hypothetical protein
MSHRAPPHRLLDRAPWGTALVRGERYRPEGHPLAGGLGQLFFGAERPGAPGGKARMQAHAAARGWTCQLAVHLPVRFWAVETAPGFDASLIGKAREAAIEAALRRQAAHGFACFASWPDAVAWTATVRHACHRHVFELIPHGRPCKPYLDIDGDPAALPPELREPAAMAAHVQALVAAVFRERYGLELTPADFVWTHAPHQAKLSLHLVVCPAAGPDLLYRDNALAADLQRRVVLADPRLDGGVVDAGVYSRDREMRVLGASKALKPLAHLVPLGAGDAQDAAPDADAARRHALGFLCSRTGAVVLRVSSAFLPLARVPKNLGTLEKKKLGTAQTTFRVCRGAVWRACWSTRASAWPSSTRRVPTAG